jgi:hypothetical protein
MKNESEMVSKKAENDVKAARNEEIIESSDERHKKASKIMWNVRQSKEVSASKYEERNK